MAGLKRTTIYLEPELLRALRLRAAVSKRSLSDTVNDAVRASLTEDAADLEAMAVRSKESVIEFGAFVRELRRRGPR